MRPAGHVMDLERLGSLHQSRLSFMRALVRRIMRERWRIDASRFELDADGHGTAIYRIHTPNGLFSFVLFSQYLAPKSATTASSPANGPDHGAVRRRGRSGPVGQPAPQRAPCRKPAGWTPARWCCRAPTGACATSTSRRTRWPGAAARRGPDHASATCTAQRRSTAAASWAWPTGKRSGAGILISPVPSPQKCSPVSCCVQLSLRQAEHRPPSRARHGGGVSNRRSSATSASAIRRPGHGAPT